MTESIEWGFFNRSDETVDSVRDLPHKEQPGSITFVTVRLADSMPKAVVRSWHNEVAVWLRENGLSEFSVEEVLKSHTISSDLKNQLRKFRNRSWHNRLDDCHGDCVLRRADCRSEVCNSILHFNSQRYDLESFIVMPNHVHVLIQMREDYSLRKQFREIQRFSARKINRILGRSGSLWQGEPFDHIVRNSSQLEYLHGYIRDNGTKAGLQNDEFTWWSCN